MHLCRVVTSANKLSVGNDSEEEKERKKKALQVCAPTSSRQRSRLGINPFGSLMKPSSPGKAQFWTGHRGSVGW